MKEILSVKVVRETDCDPDLSYLGEYSRNPGKNCIDREERGDSERGQFRYCNVTMSAEETGNPESVEQDYKRLEAYNRGVWEMVGVYAVAEVIVNEVIQTIRSGGLWGIESDSWEYFKEVEKEQLAELVAELEAVGFAEAEIVEAYRDME